MAPSKFLDPKNNFAFLQIFGIEKNKDILLHFLNDVLKYKEAQEITEESFLKITQDPEIAAYRQIIVDVLCQNKNGGLFPKKKGGWKSEHRLLDEKTFENDLKDFYFVFFELNKNSIRVLRSR
jgi:hypothetical protein